MTAPTARPPKTTVPRWIVPELIPDRAVTVIHGPCAADLSLIGLDLAAAAVSGRPFAGERDETRSAAAWRVVLFGDQFRRNSEGESVGPRARALAASRPDYDAAAIENRIGVARHPLTFTQEPGPGAYSVEEVARIMDAQRPGGKGAPEPIIAIIAISDPLDSGTLARLRILAETHALAVLILASGESAEGIVYAGDDVPPVPVAIVLEIHGGELKAGGRTIACYRVEVAQIAHPDPKGEPNTAAAWVEWERE